MYVMIVIVFCFFKQKTAYEMRISDWSSDVCSADLLHILFRDVEAGAGVVDIVEDRRPRDEAGDQAVAVARIGFVAGIVTRKADEDGRAIAAHLDRRASGPDVLVVVFEAGYVQIVAEAAARQARDRAADLDQVAARRARRPHQVGLAIGAVGGADAQFGRIGVEPPRHIFDRAADRVAAIERTLRPAQHLDPLDVVDVEHRRPRAVEIDVVAIDADARPEAGPRALLTDAGEDGARKSGE